MSLKLKGKLCVRSATVYGSETWAMTPEQSRRLERTMRMVRWMCGVSLRLSAECRAEGKNGD